MLKCGCFEGLRKRRPGSEQPITSTTQDAEGPLVAAPATVTQSAGSSAPASKNAKVAPLPGAALAPAPPVPKQQPQWVNGFRSKPEIESLRVSERSRAPFSLPQEALSYQPTDAQIFARFPGGDWERMIHCNQQLQDEELEQLMELRRLAAQDSCTFSPSVSIGATRMISDARGDVKLALQKMKDSQAWRENYFKDGPITEDVVEELLKIGVIYYGGRDVGMRPAIFVRPSRCPQKYRSDEATKKIVAVLIFCLEYFLRYMAVPGKVENVCVVVNMKDCGYMPVSMLSELGSVMSKQHACRVWRFYVCNMSWWMNVIAKMVQGVMTDRQVEKIRFVKDVSVLRQDFAKHQLEEDFGGSRPELHDCFPFPLIPGPFEIGSGPGPNPNAVQGVHEVMSREGARGQLWDPELSFEENTRIEFVDSAGDILKRCGLPVPQRLATAPQASASAPASESWPAKAQAALVGSRDESTYATSSDFRSEDGMNRQLKPQAEYLDLVEDVDMCSPQVVSCSFCKCTFGITKKQSKN